MVSMFRTAESLVQLIQCNILDAVFINKLLFHLQIIPLTYQITVIAGNTWNNTFKVFCV